MLLVLAILGLLLLPSPWGVVALGAAVAVEVLELGELRRLVRARVGEHHVVAGGDEVRDGGPADRPRPAEEEHAHAAHRSATQRLHVGRRD